jgi:fatty-acyl-CoA synthase
MPQTPFVTVAEAIAKIGLAHPQNGFTFQDMKGVETRYAFPELEVHTGRRAAALQALGLQKGDRIGIVVVEPEDFVLTFLSAVRVGIIPVPMYPPLSFGSLDAYSDRTAKILESAKAKVLVASGQLQNVLWSLIDKVPTLKTLVKVEDLRGVDGVPAYPEILPQDTAFLQYTSGSTSDPKGVIVTHANLIANAIATITGINGDPKVTLGVSWLPLYHDMGLIGFVIDPIVMGLSIVYIPTLRFIKKPTVWFDTIHAHRGTKTFAPNFAYALVAKKAKPEDLARWDLSCVDVFGCGAEPIQGQTLRDFFDVFGKCGIKPTALLPAYGMAESTLCVSVKPLGETFVTRFVDATKFQADGTVEDPADDAVVFEHVSCGKSFPLHEVAIFSEDGKRLGDRQEGEICAKGPSVCPGYYDNAEATQAMFRDGWLRTGDLGYLDDGHIYVTGRLKDLIILNGRNLHPQSIEWLCAEVDGVRKGNVVAFSRPGDASEELVIAMEIRGGADKAAIEAGVTAAIRRELGLTVADVVCLEIGTLPKTSSGKLQRRRTRQLYLEGALGTSGSRLAGSTADKLTLARHVAKSFWTRARTAVLSK